MRKLYSTLTILTAFTVIALAFQNCAEDINMDEYDSAGKSSDDPSPQPQPNPQTPNPPPPTPPTPPPPVNIAAQVTSSPGSTNNVTYLNPFKFAVSVIGDGALTYEWYKGTTRLFDSADISGTSSTQLNFRSVKESDSGNYTFKVSNAYGSDSRTMGLTVTRNANQYPPAIAAGGALKNLTASIVLLATNSSPFDYAYVHESKNSTITYSIKLTNTTNVAYEWFFISPGGLESRIVGQTGPTYTVTIKAGNYGNFTSGTYKVVATNPYGSISSSATLTVYVTTIYPEST